MNQKMKNLVAFICTGLATPGIKEDNLTSGVLSFDSTANVVGFALIGKLGISEAARLSELAVSGTTEADTAMERICSELDIDYGQLEHLAGLNHRFTVTEIIIEIKVGNISY